MAAEDQFPITYLGPMIGYLVDLPGGGTRGFGKRDQAEAFVRQEREREAAND
ncbi:hypothetical protein [Wenxinia saemankumensis]|uniref:Uncharacterized protein n=1 Tax=Wenxinia saemankumensis TaxID=1447782 RepID=A0A1M6HQ84_9RHOB|nr:hypothetical protein [Wenxinia saemankumensis]SHJ24361.1 hypothetical protein SAMN05444417_3292 [Wenxinia saemankumensis]